MTAPHALTIASAARRAAIEAAGEARAAILTTTPREAKDAVVRLTKGPEE